MSAVGITRRASGIARLKPTLHAGSSHGCPHHDSGTLHQWMRLMLQMRSLSCSTRQPVKSRMRYPSSQRSMHSDSSTGRTPITNIKEKTAAQSPWDIPPISRSSSSSNAQGTNQPAWSSGSRSPKDNAIKATAAASAHIPTDCGFIPDISSMEPGVDYWRLYQDRLNEKKPVTNTDLHRLCQWLRSKDVTNDIALKLSKLIGELRRRAVPFNLDIYNDLIHLHIKRRKFQDAQEIIDILSKEAQNMLTTQRLRALQIALYLRSGNETALQKLVEDKGNGLMPYMDQFLMWTKGLQLTSDQIDRAKRIFHDIQNTRCPPNSKRFTHLLEALFAKNRPEEAIALVKHTLDIGFHAGHFTNACIMSGVLKAKLYDEAIQIWGRITQQSEVRPEPVVYNSLLSALSQGPKTFPAAVELWNRILADPEFKPDAYSFSSMVNGYFRVHDPVSALSLWEAMQMEPYSIRPTPILINTVITGLFHNHLPEKAKDLYEKLATCNDLQIPLDTYHIMIKGLLSVLDHEALNRVLNRMLKSGVEPNEMTYNIIVDTIFSQRDAKSAVKVIELMSSRGIPKTAITYSAAIAGLVKVGALEDARKVLEEMKVAGCRPSIHTYGAMIQGAFKAGDVELAEEMANLAMTTTKEGMSPGAYSMMITGYASLLMMDQAEKWVVNMQRAALKDNITRPPWKVYYTLLKICVRSQLWGPAIRILDVMSTSEFHSTVPKLTKLIQEVERVRDGGM